MASASRPAASNTAPGAPAPASNAAVCGGGHASANEHASARRSCALPPLIEDALAALPSAEEAERIRTGFAEAAARPVTLRANTLKASAAHVAAELQKAGVGFARVPWYEDALVLDAGVRERDLWGHPLYQNGEVYLQSLSSMLPPLVLDPVPSADVLDMCAAPGGKTSQMAALAGGRAHITACELHAPRAEKLAYNLEKLGARNINVMRVDSRRLDEFFSFDQILLDAPCTGTGTFRAGDERAHGRMTEKLLDKVARSQRALLDRALTVLKPGGTLVYSTCSILPQENEEQVLAALKRHRDCELVPLAPAPETSTAGSADAGDEAVPSADEGEPRLSARARAVINAAVCGNIPTLAGTLPETLTVCPSRLYEGFFLAMIRKPR